ncbi:MAG: hypothetical protein WCE54_12495 [Ignavibacteriaceae bacterium]
MNLKWYLLFFALIFFSYGANDVLKNNSPEKGKIDYELIYLINGDGDYLYHDLKGKPHLADEAKLNEALSVAKHCSNGEVFIFHQKEKSDFLFFHSDNREFYYYRNGKLFRNETYNDHGSNVLLETEAYLYNKYRTKNNHVKKYLLYFGHEIPEIIKGSSASNKMLDVDNFTSSVKRFAGNKKFNLIVLSTCHNGTPGTILKLSPFADYIIASPENLHLSNIDTKYFESLDSLKQTDFQFAKSFAETAFENLKKRTQTVVTIVLYDTQKTSKFLNRIKDKYLSIVHSLERRNNASFDYIDLNEKPELFHGNSSEGIISFYRPSRFGVDENKLSHSGWEIIVAKKSMQ